MTYSRMTRSRWLLTALPALLILCLTATPAWAEDEGQPQDAKAKIKAKMEKILKLMKANEKALLELSAGKDAAPRRVDVEVPPPDGKGSESSGGESSSGESSGGESSGGTSSGGSSSEDIGKRLDELLRAQEGGSKIPGELKELVEMIPT